jgi:predicted phosphohydrolase
MHLEFRENNFSRLLQCDGDILCLAGDICCVGNKRQYNTFLAFLAFICPKFTYVLHVAGNHEYYTDIDRKEPITAEHTIGAIDKKLKGLESTFANYRYLNCDAITLTIRNKKYGFIGATLWSKVSPKNHKLVEENMNDYNYIYAGSARGKPSIFTVRDMQALHRKHLSFIKAAVAASKKKRYPHVLITHHKPVGDSRIKDQFTEAYETDITAHVEAPIRYVIYGHTHEHYDRTIAGVRYLSNPIGYPYQRTKFDRKLSVTLP